MRKVKGVSGQEVAPRRLGGARYGAFTPKDLSMHLGCKWREIVRAARRLGIRRVTVPGTPGAGFFMPADAERVIADIYARRSLRAQRTGTPGTPAPEGSAHEPETPAPASGERD